MARNGNGNDAVINACFYVVGAIILCLVGWGLWRAWDDATSPVFKLRKDQWTCSSTRTRTITSVGGKFGRVHTSAVTTCDQYSRSSG